MASSIKRLLVLLTCVFLATSAYAQSPREQLQQLTVQLQQTPNDTALRERIIKLGAKIKPAPAVPEEARRPFVEGVTILKSAKDAGSQQLALGSFHEALKIAPWWGDAYYNLAVAQELTGQLNDAERTLKWFMLTNPGESDAREAQDRVYALGAKRKMAAVEAGAGAKQEQADREMAEQRAAVEAQARRFEGNWYQIRWTTRREPAVNHSFRVSFTIRRDASGKYRLAGEMFSHGEREAVLAGMELRFRDDSLLQRSADTFQSLGTYDAIMTVSTDGNTLEIVETLRPLTSEQLALRADWGKSYPNFEGRWTRQ